MTNIFEKSFGKVSGREARLFVLDSGSLRVGLTDFGCTTAFIITGDRSGNEVNAVLGYGDARGYALGSSYVGAVVGRYAGRIGRARFTLNGRLYELERNDGENHLHGGFSKRFWDAEQVESGIRFTLVSPDMDEGFPGELRVSVTAEVIGGTLRFTYEAETESDTHINLTNHSYFNLNGGGSVNDHLLCVNANRFAQADPALIPTGEFRSVHGTPLDFTRERPLSAAIRSPFLRASRGLDHSFITDRPCGPYGLADAARVSSPASGITLTCRTTQPSVHIYTAGFVNKDAYGRFPVNGAVCLETQHLPDSPNKPEFPGTLLKKGDVFREITEYSFAAVR